MVEKVPGTRLSYIVFNMAATKICEEVSSSLNLQEKRSEVRQNLSKGKYQLIRDVEFGFGCLGLMCNRQ